MSQKPVELVWSTNGADGCWIGENPETPQWCPELKLNRIDRDELGQLSPMKTKSLSVKPPANVKSWDRVRFRASPDDYRCISWPPPGPYWCSGFGDNYSTIVAYVPHGTTDMQLLEQWPEATHIDRMQEDVKIEFSDRFPKPEYWNEN